MTTGVRPSEPPPVVADLLARVRATPWLQRFTLMNRLLLAMAFLPTGLVKLTGQRFTTLPVDDPVGFFFEAMYRTGPYWRFIGLVQVLAALLLLVPRTATLGAVLFLPVVGSILLITVGVGFGLTAVIVAGMLLAVAWLLCWDADRIWAAAAALWGSRSELHPLRNMHWLEGTGWILGGAAGMALFLATGDFLPMSLAPALLGTGLLAMALVIGGGVAGALRGGRRS